MSLLIKTECGPITLTLRPDIAPVTVAHILRHVSEKLYDVVTFYRSDFVIQMGLYGTPRASSHPPLQVNESGRGASNRRGTLAVAHHDKPDNGSTELFINLQDNSHLDTAYGGYCVWANVKEGDAESWKTVDAIAAAVKGGKKVVVQAVTAF